MHFYPLVRNNFQLGVILFFLSIAGTSKEQTVPFSANTRKDVISPTALLSAYIQIPSISGNENKAADFLMEQCRKRGLIITKITDSTGCSNFAASVYPLKPGKPNIIFLNHIDVVPPGDSSGWKHPPFEGYTGNGKVWGRGTLDNKGMAIIQLFAVKGFVDTARVIDLPYNITILCVSGEETGGAKGSAIVSKKFKEMFNPVLVIGEGGSGMVGTGFLPEGRTFFGISVAEKGFLWLKLSCRIEGAGHAAIAGSDYANEHMIKGLSRLVQKRQPVEMTSETKQMFHGIGKQMVGIKGFAVRHLNWIIFRPALNRYVNRNHELEPVFSNTFTISGLGNQISSSNRNIQEATAYVDCRFLPGTSPAALMELLNKQIADKRIHIDVLQECPKQFSTSPELFYNHLAGAIQQTFPGSVVVPILLPASTDNSYYRASGCPVYGLNPMILSKDQIASIHNYDEYIEVEAIEKGIQVFDTFLRSVLMPVNPASELMHPR